MMKRIVSITIFFILLSMLGYSDVYKWVDAKGVKHFADSPPSANTVPSDKVKRIETPEYQFEHILYRKDDQKEYCGNIQLPERNEDLPVFAEWLLVDSKRKYKKLEDDPCPNNSMCDLKYVERRLGEYECTWLWAAEVMKESGQIKP